MPGPSILWISEPRLTTGNCVLLRNLESPSFLCHGADVLSPSQSGVTEIPSSLPGAAELPLFQPLAAELPPHHPGAAKLPQSEAELEVSEFPQFSESCCHV